jgi:hypothetical protein
VEIAGAEFDFFHGMGKVAPGMMAEESLTVA